MPSVSRREFLRLSAIGLGNAAIAPPLSSQDINRLLFPTSDKEPHANKIIPLTETKHIQRNCGLAIRGDGKVYAAAIEYFSSPQAQNIRVWEYNPKTPNERAVSTNFPEVEPHNYRESLSLITDNNGEISAYGNISDNNPTRNNVQTRAEGYSLKNGVWDTDWSWLPPTTDPMLPCSSRAHAAFRREDGIWVVWMEDYFYNSRPGPGKQPGYFTENKILLLGENHSFIGFASVDSPTGYTMFPTMAEGNGHILSVHTAARNPGEKRSLTLQTFSTNDLSKSGMTEVIVTKRRQTN